MRVNKIFPATIKAVDSENYTVDAIVTTETPDRDNEIVEVAGFKKGLKSYLEHPILLSCHGWDDLRKNIGIAEKFSFNDNTIEVRFRYLVGKGNEEADWAFQLAKENIAAYSIGFLMKEWRNPSAEEKAASVQRVHTDFEVLEISQVLIPANRDALQVRQVEGLLAMKAIDANIKLPVFEKKVIPYKNLGIAPAIDTEWDGSKEITAADIETLKLICTWYDIENPDVKASYKLPHHRATGNHRAVWRGVSAAMGALLGARGGVDIPDSDRRGCYNHLAEHYAEFEKDVPEFKDLSYTTENTEESNLPRLQEKYSPGIFEIQGDTEVTDEHFHLFVMLKDKNGVIAGQTVDTFSAETVDTFSAEHHKHLIVSENETTVMNNHSHAIKVFGSKASTDRANEADGNKTVVYFDDDIWQALAKLSN